MVKKIYLTYKQLETLCFSKITFISEEQLNFSRSKKFYEFAVFVDDDNILREKGNIILLFSSLTKIETPKSEFNLFKNQFKLPLGLLALADRKVPKDSSEETSPSNIDNIVELYSRLRRSFTQLVLFGYKKNYSVQDSLSKFLNKITNLSTFESLLIKNISKNGDFPQQVLKEIQPEEYYKFVWWGKFFIDTVLIPQGDKISEEESKAHRGWFKGIDWRNLSNNLENFKSIPPLFKEHYGVMLGYFLSSLSSNNIDKENIGNEVDNILKKIRDVDNEYEILFWGIFFQAFFVEELDYSYPNPLIHDDFYKMEVLSFSIAEKLLENSEKEIKCDFSFKKVNFDDLVINFEKLKEEKTKVNPIILDESELKKPFENSSLFGKKKDRIGFINQTVNKASYLEINKEGFKLESKFTNPPVVYYGTLQKEEKEVLKKSGINIKTKDISTLISKESKVLVAFLPEYTSIPLLQVYKSIIKSNKTRLVDFVFVWLVSKDNKTLHSTEFSFEKDNLKKRVELDFGLKTTIIIKNLNSESIEDIEVIRNLRLALKDYKAKNIEVIDYGFEEKHASWIIGAINDYIVKSNDVDYFSFKAV